MGNLEHTLTKATLEKVKRITIHSITRTIQYSHFFDLAFKERLLRQTEEKKPQGELALPVSVNTDFS